MRELKKTEPLICPNCNKSLTGCPCAWTKAVDKKTVHKTCAQQYNTIVENKLADKRKQEISLMEQRRRGRGEVKEKIKSTCPMCDKQFRGCACNFKKADDGQVVHARCLNKYNSKLKNEKDEK